MKALLLLALVSASLPAAPKAEDVVLRDARRGKDLECRVHYPAAGDRLPLIVFSHGFGADKAAFASVSRHIAERGYVIVHPSHADGFGRSGRGQDGAAGRAGAGGLGALRSGGGLPARLADPATVEGRVADVVAVLDSVEQLVDRVPALKGRIDASRVGVGGHSYGAYTAMLVGGVTADLGGAKARGFADPRVRCILPISAQGTGQQGLTESSWAGLRLPMMTITGSRDQGAAGQGPEWKKEAYRLSPPGDKYLVDIEGAGHLSFGGGLGGRSDRAVEVVQVVALAFWDAHLKGDEKARQALRSGEVARRLAGAAALESK